MSRLSACTSVTSLRGKASRRASAVIATASVDARIAPSVSAAAAGNPAMTVEATPATATVLASTSPTANPPSTRQSARTQPVGCSSAAACNNGGNTTDWITSGSGDGRKARHQPERHTADRQDHRRRQVQPPGRRRQHSYHHQKQQWYVGVSHATSAPVVPCWSDWPAEQTPVAAPTRTCADPTSRRSTHRINNAESAEGTDSTAGEPLPTGQPAAHPLGDCPIRSGCHEVIQNASGISPPASRQAKGPLATLVTEF